MEPRTAVVVGSVIALVVSLYLVVRRQKPVPFPARFAILLSAPWRRWFPPNLAAQRHGLGPGLTVLEIGPGNGYLTGTSVDVIGSTGMLVGLDIQLAMLRKLQRRVVGSALRLVCASGAELPFRSDSFDRIYMLHVLGEIPDRRAALAECSRVVREQGILAVTEGLPDPDFIRRTTLIREAEPVGFTPRAHYGHSLFYTQRFGRRRRESI